MKKSYFFEVLFIKFTPLSVIFKNIFTKYALFLFALSILACDQTPQEKPKEVTRSIATNSQPLPTPPLSQTVKTTLLRKVSIVEKN